MALSEATAAYSDCYDLFEKAQNDGKGVRIHLPNRPEAHMLRMRLNQARVLERRESMRIYDRIDPRYGKSENDQFRVTIREAVEGDSWWVYIEQWADGALEVEGLSDEPTTSL